MPSVSDPGLAVRVAQSTPVPIDAELGCAPGSLLALVGPSGSGKSTLLRMIAGLVRPRHGTIACGGETWLDTDAGRALPAHRRRVGFVPQHYGLFPHLSALGNVMAGLGHLPRAERPAHAERWLERMRLGGLGARRPAELSGGQQQRVAVARALARDPLVLLLDEPFSAVDRVTRERLYGELAEVKATLSIPVVLVTHDLSEGMMLADRLSILAGGRTLQTGTPQEVRARPVSEEVARLVGIRNLFDGEVIGHDDERGFTLLRFGPATLETPLRRELARGRHVRWAIPGSGVILHRRDRPSRGEAENPVDGTISRLLVLGDETRIVMATAADPRLPLQFEVPTHVAQRNRLAPDAGVRVSLRAEAIHVLGSVEGGAAGAAGARSRRTA